MADKWKKYLGVASDVANANEKLEASIDEVVTFVREYQSDTFSGDVTPAEVLQLAAALIERSKHNVDGVYLSSLLDDIRGDA